MSSKLVFVDTKAKAMIQLHAAVEYCKENNWHGYKPIKEGICPSIKDPHTINSRLDNVDQPVIKRRSNSAILTLIEEKKLVAFIKNKNHACQGFSRADVEKLVNDFLTIRSAANKKLGGGRNYVALTKPARTFMLTKKLSKSFWQKLESRYEGITRKRQGSIITKGCSIITKGCSMHEGDDNSAFG